MDLAYSFRPNAFTAARSFRLRPAVVEGGSPNAPISVYYSDIAVVEMRRYRPVGRLALKVNRLWRCTVVTRLGRSFDILPTDCVAFGALRDQSSKFHGFVNELISRAKAANPGLEVRSRFDWRIRFSRAAERFVTPRALWLARTLGCSPGVLASSAFVAGCVGPLTKAHRIARENMRGAYPEKSKGEIRRLLRLMWRDVGRMMMEYANLNTLWAGYDNGSGAALVECDDETRARIEAWRGAGKGVLIFAAHLANVELLSMAGPAFGLDLAVVHCQVPVERRSSRWNPGPEHGAIGVARGAAFEIQDALRRGRQVSMAVDQHFPGGVPVTFFGRACAVNPTIARVARLTECAIHGARMVRLADNRFRLEVTEALNPEREPGDRIDVAATMQSITRLVETWVREHPEQWQWWHRRWRA